MLCASFRFPFMGLRVITRIWLLSITLFAASCSSIGPQTVNNDRLDYSSALATSWKDQTLLNIVKFRYLDAPIFLDVSSVVSSREVFTEANVTPRIFPSQKPETYIEGNVGGRYTDRPTISYTPLSGERLVNNQLRPIPPAVVFSMIEAGHDPATILLITARSISGLYNHFVSVEDLTASSDFGALLLTLREIHRQRGLGVRSEQKGKETRTWIYFRRSASGDLARQIAYVKRLLHLDNRAEYLLTPGSRPKAGAISVLTRSLHEVMAELSTGVEVPEADLETGRAPRLGRADSVTQGVPILQVKSGASFPPDAYAHVYYRNRYFWIDDGDIRSKRSFLILLLFTALAENQNHQQVPILTTPTR